MHRPETAFLSLAIAGATAAAAVAQVVPLATATGCLAKVGATVQAIAGGTDVTAGTAVGVGTGSGNAALHFVPDQDTVAVLLGYDAASVAVATTTAQASAEIRHEVWSARPLVGRLVVTWSTTVSGTGSATFGIDVGDDGSVEATGAAVVPCALVAGMTPIRVRIATAANAGTVSGPWGTGFSYQGAASAHLTIRFEPMHCSATALGGGCPGTQLNAIGNLAGGVDLRASCGSGDDLAVLLLAFDPAMAVSTPFPACTLLAAPVATLWSVPDTTHAARWSFVWPTGVGPVAFAAQVIAIDASPFVASASGALAVACQ